MELDPTEELQRTILSSIIQSSNDKQLSLEVLTYTLTRIKDEHMAGKLFTIWKTLSKYFITTGAIPDQKMFNDILETTHTLQVQDKLDLSEQFSKMSMIEVSPVAYKIACQRLIERYRDERYTQLLAKTQRIYFGSESGKSGYSDSLQSLRSGLAEIERLDNGNEYQEGEFTDEANEFLKNYLASKKGTGDGIYFGFTELDDLTHGMQPGELILLSAFTGEGKSKTVYNIAYSAAFLQNHNVLIGTNESTRIQVRRNLISRHSRHPKFNYPKGLKYSDLKFGSLDFNGEEVLKAVLQDIKYGSHGKCFIFQLPHRANPDFISEVLYRQTQLYKIDLLIIDYLGLMASSIKRSSRREELDDLIMATKRLAVEFNIPILSPWQVSREAWKDAQKSGGYSRIALSETAQSERCQPANSLVLSDVGYKPIQDINVGDLLPIGGKVLAKANYKTNSLIEIKSGGMNFSKFTLEHRIPVIRRNRCKHYISQHQRLCHPDCFQTCSTKPKFEYIQYIKAKDLTLNDFVLIPILSELKLTEIGTEFAWLISEYIADGNLLKKNQLFKGFVISFGSRKFHYLDSFVSYLKDLGFTPIIWHPTKRENAICISIYNSRFARWLYSQFGEYALLKRIPEWLIRAPKEFISCFLSKYPDKVVSEYTRFTSSNLKILYSIQLMFARLGFLSTICRKSSKSSIYKTKQPYCYYLQLRGHASISKRFEDRFILHKINSIKEVAGDVVYGIETETGLYNSGINVHNSTDLIVSLLRQDDKPQELFCQVLKYRDGESNLTFNLSTDFGTCYVSSKLEHQQLLKQLD